MKTTLQPKPRLLALIIALFMGTSGTANLFAQSTFPEGALSHVFSVPEGSYVFFSQGNLQYIGSASTPYWKFADHQWDYFGSTTDQFSENENVDRDFFCWGTSGYNHGAVGYQPWSTRYTSHYYDAYGSDTYNLYDQTGQADWGYNAISNGGNTENCGWRTLTTDEWEYLFNTRSTPSGIRYAKAKVNNVSGVILLPDDWSSIYYTLNSTNISDADFTSNRITASQWNTLEQHGAVFLPAAGYREAPDAYGDGCGRYWSSSYYNIYSAYCVSFGDGFFHTGAGSIRSYGYSVRLVRSAQNYSFGINATPNPAQGGTVNGGGAYSTGTECTLTATPSDGYSFANWMENGTVVSTNATYTFTVNGERNLVANFVQEVNITFADANVKDLCVANWDTNGNGELSYAEAAVVTSLGDVFQNNTTIQSFTELEYFISLVTIGEQAFYGCTALTQVTIPQYVTSVGSQAFWNCPALQTVNFNAVNCTSMQTTYNSNTYSVFSSNTSGAAPAITKVVFGSNVTRIPDYAFYNASNINTRLVIRSSVTEIGNYAFYGCNSMSQMLIQGNGLQSIGDYAFYNCSALSTALNIPNSVTGIGQYAFYGCSQLLSVTIGEGVTSIGGYAFWNCPNLATVNFNAVNCTSMQTTYNSYNLSVFSSDSDGEAPTITKVVIGNNVTRIPDYAFYLSSNAVGGLTIPNSVTSIGNYAFCGCSGFTGSLTIPNSVTSIGNRAFYGCSGFTGSLTISNSVTTIGESAFGCCSGFTGSLTIPNSVTTIAEWAFYACDGFNGSLTLPNSVTSIGDYVFRGCSGFTGDLVIPNSVTSIGYYAFGGCSGFTGSLTLPNSVTSIGYYAFGGCSGFTGDLVIPNSVTYIGYYAFGYCSGFTGSLTIPNSVITIGAYAFNGCSGFTGSLVIPNSVTSIASCAFQNCSGITALIVERLNPATARSDSFEGMNYTIPFHVPYGKISAYQSATGWSNFTNRKEQYQFEEYDDNLWSDDLNWYQGSLPGANDVVCLISNCHLDVDANVFYLYVQNTNDVLTINNGKTLTVTSGIGTQRASQLVIAEGGQLVNYYGNGCGTVQRNINGYGTGDDGWYTIAAPIHGGMPINNLTTGTYDLYYYDEPTLYWMNVKQADNNFTTLNPAQGYLYANQSPRTVNLAGQLNASHAEISVPVSYTNGELAGFNLVGNPYTNNINIGDVKINGTAQTAFYRAEGGSSLLAYVAADNEPIKPGDGFFVKATEAGTLTFGSSRSRGESQQDGYVRLVLRKGDQVADRAYLRMNEGERLEKMCTSTAHSLLYFENNGSRYAVANNEAGNGMMPLFLGKANGTYTIEATLLNAECGYLHLIDNLTGTDIDLLALRQAQGPASYTFEASPTDRVDRFALILAEGAQPEAIDIKRTRDLIPILPPHGSSNNEPAYSQTNIVQGITLTAGWNWFSPYVKADDPIELLQMLKVGLGENAEMILSMDNGMTAFDGEEWFGDMDDYGLANTQMYMILTNAACTVEMEGKPVNVTDFEISIKPGWNWIGFPSAEALDVENALAGFAAEEGDILLSQDNGLTSYDGEEWFGDLETLAPGVGLMYYSSSSEMKTLVYSTAAKGKGSIHLGKRK